MKLKRLNSGNFKYISNNVDQKNHTTRQTRKQTQKQYNVNFGKWLIVFL